MNPSTAPAQPPRGPIEGAAIDPAAFLAGARCTVHGRLSVHEPARYNLLTHQARVALAGRPQPCTLLESSWKIALRATPVPDRGDALDLEVSFECTRGPLASASVSVDLDFSDWSEANYVLLPAAAYNGNRFASRRLRYSPKLYEVQDIGPEKPMIVSDIPRLADSGGVSRIQERSGSMATPSIGFHAPSSGTGFWLQSLHGNRLGDYGFSIEETRHRDRAIVSITSPIVREVHSYRICDARFPSIDQPSDFETGATVTIAFRVHCFPARGLQGLFDRFALIRKDLRPPSKPRCPLPYSACFGIQEEKFNALNFVPEHGYYSVGFRENFLQDWQIGWTGGMISTYPLLYAGGAQTRRNVLRNFDWLFPAGLCPAGFFWDCGRNGTEWIGGDIRKPHTGNWHLIRKSGDGVYYVLKQFRLMEKQGIAVKPEWSEGTRRVCDALVRLWRKWGQFGQFVDSRSGDVIVGGSSGGGIIPAALVLAAAYYGNAEYLEVARQAAEHLYVGFTSKGLSCGGPGDALQNNDSESCYALIESYALLYESTGERIWLDRASEQSRQFATWVVTYDYPFPPSSLFGRAGIRSTGAVYANTQNKHGAPGICTYSGIALLRLFRATGDRFHLDLLHDIAHNLPQYLPHPLKPLAELPIGRMCERVNITDWEGPERIGEVATPTNWAETSLMLTKIEIPGIYVQPEAGLAVAFDSVEVAIESASGSPPLLRATNPTKAAAEVSILVESSAQAAEALGENALWGRPLLHLDPGESRTIRLDCPERRSPAPGAWP